MKWRSLFYVFISIISLTFRSAAQTHRVDSLLNILKTSHEDTAKCLTLIDLCAAYRRDLNDLQKVGEYNSNLMYLSRKLNYKKGKAYAYLNEGTLAWSKGEYLRSIDYAQMSLKIMKEIGDKRGMGNCYNNLGNVYNDQGDYEKALEFTAKAGKLYESVNDKRGVGNAYSNMARTYLNLGNYSHALTYNFKSLKIREEIKDKLGTSISLNNIGIVFENQNSHTDALKYYTSALKIKQEIDDKYGMGMTYNNIANTYTAIDNYRDALTNHVQALKIRTEIGDQQGIGMSNLNIGNLYVKQNKLKESIPYYTRSLKIYKEIGDQAGYLEACNGLSNCYEKQGNYEEALKYTQQGLEIATKINFKEGIRDSYQNLTSIYEKLGNYKLSLQYNKLFTAIKDTILNERSTKQMVEMNTRFETDKKEKEIQLLTKDQQLANKTLKEQRIVRIGLISGLGLLIILSFTLYNRYRFKQKANLLLEKQKQEIHNKNVLITDSIDYAKTIQEAILPDDEKLNEFFPQHFILYKPKSIVSGDFYWIGKKDETLICAVADCTGHGVPGAFMSLLGNNMLENVVGKKENAEPGSMLTALNKEIINRLSKGKEKETVKHGMDIAIISIDQKNILQYAGARNSVYVVRGGELTEIKADKMSTGIVANDQQEVRYTNNEKQLQKGDMIYLFSDGFPDQKGEVTKKKFYYQPFKDLFVSIHKQTMTEQKQSLDDTITKWIGQSEQIDDILVMGIRI
ncbi:MAG TPA: tetratricopeptide repeat protein [Bacteroidia bacterium]|jgi:tetratricopeptide (TPR) repeat protein|nr:tetratricopeptide repeat protein [Bacteroidia bacterium]